MRWSADQSPARRIALPMSRLSSRNSCCCKPGSARGQLRHAREREPAQRHRVERDRIAGIALAVDRVEPDDLARQVEPEHLLAAVAVDDVGLDRAGAHRGDRVEGSPLRNT